jgi:hypothetical protein
MAAIYNMEYVKNSPNGSTLPRLEPSVGRLAQKSARLGYEAKRKVWRLRRTVCQLDDELDCAISRQCIDQSKKWT